MFFWIFAAVALVLAFAPPRFRKIGFAVFGAVFIVFLTIVLVNRRSPPAPAPVAAAPPGPAAPPSRRFDFDAYQREKRDKEDPEAKTRIAIAEIRFDQLQPIAGIEPRTLQAVHARLYNDSHQFTLTDYSYYLVVQDCLPTTTKSATANTTTTNDNAADRCTTVYDQRDSVSLVVPPNQARDVAISIPKNATSFAAPFKLLGTPRIELEATDTRAYQSSQSTP